MRWFRPRATARRHTARCRNSPPSPGRWRQRRLQFEPLEERQLLATLTLALKVFEDDGGQPGSEIIGSPAIVTVGDAFWIRVLAEDDCQSSRSSCGVISLPLDVAWAGTAAVTFVGQKPTAGSNPASLDVPPTNPLVTFDFPLQRFVDTDGSDGEFLNLRGGALPNAGIGQAIGNGEPGEFSLMQFTADAAGTETFTAVLAGSMSFADAARLDNEPSAEAIISVVPLSGIEGQKFEDLNANGVKDSGEPGLPNWQFYVDYDDDGAWDSATEPDAHSGSDGAYVISQVKSGTWKVREVVQADWTNSYPTTSDAHGRYWQVTVQSGNSVTGIDFGNWTAMTSLAGFVYVDANNDGERKVDADGMPVDLPLPNVEIKLFQQGQAEYITKVTTGPDGWYHFENLTPGINYTIRETPPNGLVDGKETLGTIIQEGQAPTSSGATAGQDEFSHIVLAAGQHGIDFNFGELGLSEVNKRLFLASTPTGEELVCKPLIAAAFVQGTEDDDTITLDNDGESIRVLITPADQVVYGPQQLRVFPLSQVQMVSIDALGGTDTVTLNGTSANEVTHLQPGTASLRTDVDLLTSGYGVKVKNAEDITVTAGTGTDWAVIRDSPGTDALTSNGDTVAIDWNSGKLTAKATGFDTARALTQSNAQDTAKEEADATTVLKLLGKWKTL